MNRKIYTIKDRTDREGVSKETPSEWLEKQYEITFAEIGRRGFLACVDYNGYGLDTSAVESVSEDNQGVVTIVTRNTIYILEPVKGV